ncbi:MAG TPA: hypothetical protein VJH37_01870 [Candidatus Nanoarchaeia archaeon]|nr:hypothetical protein [Candidatus Nanoarchaeia archaeon]
MKQLLSIFLLSLLFLSSFSVALAEENSSYGSRNRMEERQQQILEKQEQREAKLDERILKTEEKRQELRQKMQERLDDAKTRKIAIDSNAQTLRERCRAQETMEGNCGEAFTKIKEHLTKTVDRMIEAFTALKSRLQSADTTIPSDQLQTIETALTTLQSLKDEITAAKTREDLKAVMTKVRETWVKYKQSFKERQIDAYKQRATSLLQKAERIQSVLKQALLRVKTNDADASQASAIEGAIQSIDTQITNVRQALNQGDKTVIKDSLQKLHDLLQNAIKQFKQAGKGDAIASVTKSKTEPAPVQEVI